MKRQTDAMTNCLLPAKILIHDCHKDGKHATGRWEIELSLRNLQVKGVKVFVIKEVFQIETSVKTGPWGHIEGAMEGLRGRGLYYK